MTERERAERREHQNSLQCWRKLAPRVGFEPTTLRLTAGRSTIELPRNGQRNIAILILLAVRKQVNAIHRGEEACRRSLPTSCSVNSRPSCERRFRNPQSAGVTSPTPAKKGGFIGTLTPLTAEDASLPVAGTSI